MKWIKVTDRLPDISGRYLAFPSTINEVCTALYWKDKVPTWQDLEDHTEPWTPTYWRPLPSRPQASND